MQYGFEILTALGVPAETVNMTRRAMLTIEVNEVPTLELETILMVDGDFEFPVERYRLIKIEDDHG